MISDENFTNMKGVSGVYCIKIDDLIVYVGKSKDLYSRIKSHKRHIINYDSKISLENENKYKVLNAANVEHNISFEILYFGLDFDEKEMVYIREYLPLLNYQIPHRDNWKKYDTNEYARTITLDQLLSRRYKVHTYFEWDELEKMKSFEKMNKQGLEVQEIVKKHLEKRGSTIIDVSQDKEYQKKDIDFIVRKDGEEITLEVKQDKSLYRTNNIFIECGFQRGGFYSAGWADYCEADYICFYDTTAEQGIIVDRVQLLSLLDKGKKIDFYDKLDDLNGKAILIPLALASSEGVIKYKWNKYN